jgi:phosphate/sulfate permease
MGVALVIYPYAVSLTWVLYAVGVALCLGVWVDRNSIVDEPQ